MENPKQGVHADKRLQSLGISCPISTCATVFPLGGAVLGTGCANTSFFPRKFKDFQRGSRTTGLRPASLRLFVDHSRGHFGASHYRASARFIETGNIHLNA